MHYYFYFLLLFWGNACQYHAVGAGCYMSHAPPSPHLVGGCVSLCTNQRALQNKKITCYWLCPTSTILSPAPNLEPLTLSCFIFSSKCVSLFHICYSAFYPKNNYLYFVFQCEKYEKKVIKNIFIRQQEKEVKGQSTAWTLTLSLSMELSV